MIRAGFLCIILIISFLSNAQSVKGVIVDPVDNIKVRGATIKLRSAEDTTHAVFTTSGADGKFVFNGIGLGKYMLQASSIGYEFLQQPVNITDSVPNVDLGEVYLPKKTQTLEGVVVVYQPPAARQKADTTEFSAAQYKMNPDATVEDLIKKMPGVTVDKSGTVTAQGEQVKKVTVDGKDFFGDDATAALKNLPSELVDKIQVYDRLSDQAQLTGFDDGNSSKAINVVTRSGVRNGQFGRIYAGYGTDNRYQGGGNISFFSGDRRISFIGNFNNVNQQNFGSQDLLGVTSSGGGGRGGRGGGGNFGGGDFIVGTNPGINTTNALGINYGDKWGKKINVTGSYFFNNSNNNNASNYREQRPYLKSVDTLMFTYNESENQSKNYNHRFNMRVEYKIDSSNSIFIIPSINFQNNRSDSRYSGFSYLDTGDSITSTSGSGNSYRHGYNIGNTIMFRHSFAKRGRTFSTSFNTRFSKNDGESFVYDYSRFFNNGAYTDSTQDRQTITNRNTQNYSGRLSYTEPVGKKGMIELNYSPGIQISKADQVANGFDGSDYTIFIPNNSNKFDNEIITNNAGINYRLGQSRDNQLSFGIDYQNAQLISERIYPNKSSVNQTFNSFLPNLRWMKKIGTYSNVRAFYRANTNFPSIDQLQDVPNTASLTRPSVGNPNLQQSYSHFGSLRYSYTNTKKNNGFFANLFAQATNDYITNASYFIVRDSLIEQGAEVKRGAQLSKPVNLNGYKRISSFFTYYMPVSFIKSNINLNFGLNYSEIPGLVDYNPTLAKTTNYNGRIGLSSNISEYFDYQIYYDINKNNAKSNNNRDRTYASTNYQNQAAGVQLNMLTKNGWFLQNDISYQNTSGYSEGYNQSYALWNAGVGKKFMKNQAGELKLSVFDLLKQNQSITRTISAGNIITDSQSQVLQQYFMLTFTYKLRNFGKGRAASPGSGDERRGEWRERGGMPGGPPPGGRNF